MGYLPSLMSFFHWVYPDVMLKPTPDRIRDPFPHPEAINALGDLSGVPIGFNSLLRYLTHPIFNASVFGEDNPVEPSKLGSLVFDPTLKRFSFHFQTINGEHHSVLIC